MTGGHADQPLPADQHTHCEWSWDARAGSMDGSCARAAALGLPAIAFTEHFDLVRWSMPPAERAAMTARDPQRAGWWDGSGCLQLPELELSGYVESIERCRSRYPRLRILTGVELGEPHWFPEQVAALLRDCRFERVLGSLHSVERDGRRWPVDALLRQGHRDAEDPRPLLRLYLDELLRLAGSSAPFEVLAHVDYPLRELPPTEAAARFAMLEDEYRAVLRLLARSGRALEVNTRLPLDGTILHWWHQEGGQSVSFGSDAHQPEAVARNFSQAAELVRAAGFRPPAQPDGFWHL